ncbi:hypothetical protein FOMPIDRAFT_1048140 [Fomitopsis schrenkii]|uniref:Uncharacterized protein n=1 Tax=Fomitopsis schrenkii TaxID=2126942 RepID=S8EAU5_FOMSC|nr:hypothetical protein FOMPIDRAFT_1048140 [Fomitopsis schrenkii]
MSDAPLPISPITGDPSVLSTSKGPPLILVFLASGLLVGAVLTILLLRHVYPNRFASRTPPVRARKPNRPPGERPKLWDVYCYSDAESGGGRWASVLPLAAAFPPEPEEPVTEPAPATPAYRPHPWPWVDGLLRTFRHRRHAPAHADVEQASAATDGDRPSMAPLQIAVIVAMPSRQSALRGSWSCPEKAPSPEPEEETELCIGFAEVPDVARYPGQIAQDSDTSARKGNDQDTTLRHPELG